MVDLTEDSAVVGSQVGVIHADESGDTETTRTMLAQASAEDLTATIEDEDEDFTPAARYATQRYIVSGTMDLEMSSALAPSLDQLELLSIADSDGALNRSPGDRRISGDEYLEWAFFDGEPDYETVDVLADSEILMRFGDVQVVNPEVDASASPIVVSFEGYVNGEFYFDYSRAVENGGGGEVASTDGGTTTDGGDAESGN